MHAKPILGIFNLGGWEIILILATVLILFGAKKLPELAKGLGQGIKEFKKATDNIPAEARQAVGGRATSPLPLSPRGGEGRRRLSPAPDDTESGGRE